MIVWNIWRQSRLFKFQYDCTGTVKRCQASGAERLGQQEWKFQNTVSQKPKISPTSSTEYNGDKQFVVICSEKQARVSNLLFVFSCLQILGITDITEVN